VGVYRDKKVVSVVIACFRAVNTGGVVGTKHDSIERIHEGVLGQFFECVMIFFFALDLRLCLGG
jgi:hypothetical protein